MPPLTPSLTRDRTPRERAEGAGKGKRYARVHGRTGLNPARATASTGSQQSESYAELKLTRTTIKPQYRATRQETHNIGPLPTSLTHTGTVSIWVQVTPTPPYEWCARWVWVMGPLAAKARVFSANASSPKEGIGTRRFHFTCSFAAQPLARQRPGAEGLFHRPVSGTGVGERRRPLERQQQA